MPACASMGAVPVSRPAARAGFSLISSIFGSSERLALTTLRDPCGSFRRAFMPEVEVLGGPTLRWAQRESARGTGVACGRVGRASPTQRVGEARRRSELGCGSPRGVERVPLSPEHPSSMWRGSGASRLSHSDSKARRGWTSARERRAPPTPHALSFATVLTPQVPLPLALVERPTLRRGARPANGSQKRALKSARSSASVLACRGSRSLGRRRAEIDELAGARRRSRHGSLPRRRESGRSAPRGSRCPAPRKLCPLAAASGRPRRECRGCCLRRRRGHRRRRVIRIARQVLAPSHRCVVGSRIQRPASQQAVDRRVFVRRAATYRQGVARG